MNPLEIREFLAPLLPLTSQWVREAAAHYAAQGRVLAESEFSIARATGVQHSGVVRLASVSQMPSPSNPDLRNAMDASSFWTQNAAGLTLQSTILIREGHFSHALLAHELVHVAQFERLGVEAFLQLYFEQVLGAGYQNAPLELEARQLENQFDSDPKRS